MGVVGGLSDDGALAIATITLHSGRVVGVIEFVNGLLTLI